MQQIRRKILNWYNKNKRDLPWRGSNDPYVIWLTEIIMQQTRIEQGTPYFQKFLKKYPDIFSFAKASEHDILKIWQGLGYYSRARNMHHTAKIIVQDFQGEFPNNYKELMKLKGIGDYTASIILSVCFNIPCAVVDGNVFRVLSRIFGVKEEMHTTKEKGIYKKLAEDLLDKKYPGDFNQAMMDLGAVVCTPQNPQCEICPVQKDCYAFQNDEQTLLPVKSIKSELKKRYFNYFYITDQKNILLKKRIENDIWKNLYDLPLIETKRKVKIIREKVKNEFGIVHFKFKFIKNIKHILSHQELNINFYKIDIKNINEITSKTFTKTELEKIKNYAIPKPIETFLYLPIHLIKS